MYTKASYIDILSCVVYLLPCSTSMKLYICITAVHQSIYNYSETCL